MLRVPRRIASRTIATYPHLSLLEHDVRYDDAPIGFSVQTLSVRDWCVAAAITREGQWILVEQHRHGIDSLTLETAGGIIDEGEAPQDAARRELFEETGFEAASVTPLGWVHPDPALLSNRAFLYLFRDAERAAEPQQSHDERTRVVLLSRSDLIEHLEDARVSHTLAVIALMRALARC
ncbi:MAG: NUDIX hydrolase [Polyangiaceae bacterium]|nr:NUDIX hydrolase [Polyangiaceae bacterium]